MQAVKMYTTAVCPYCIRAKQILKSKGVEQIEEIRIDSDPQARAAMMDRTRRRTGWTDVVAARRLSPTPGRPKADCAALGAQRRREVHRVGVFRRAIMAGYLQQPAPGAPGRALF